MRSAVRRFLLCCVGLVASFAAVADYDAALFQNLHWRLVGPFRGGRVLAVSGIPGEPEHYYFGAVNGGVWETHDAGRSWQPIFDGQPVGSIGALAVAPSDHRRLYVGTGEADMRSDIAQGEGLFRSEDGGAHWTRSGLEDSQQIARILVDPRDANTVYVAALGHPYGPNAERGVFKSSDGGAHWRKVLYRDDATGAISLAFKPGDPETIYAALWQTRRPPWNIYPPSNGPGSGVWKSTDAGEHWVQLKEGLPADAGRIGLATSTAAPERLYAMVDATEGGLYRSDDAGAHWTWASGDPRIWQRGWYFGEITVDPKNADRVWALNTIVLRSEDGGKTFVPQQGDETGDDYHTLWIDPDDSARQILGVDQGAVVTHNGGKTWSSWHNQPTAQIYHVVTDNRFPYWLYGSQQDSGAVALPSRSVSRNGISMAQFHETTVGGESDMIAPDPLDPDKVYGGDVDRLDLKTEQTRRLDATLAWPDLYRRTWTLPLTFSERDPHLLYFANQKLFRTSDGGEHWLPISPDLTRENPGVPPNLDAATAADNEGRGPRRGVIYAIAPSRTVDGTIWIGTDDGLVWRTQDEGAHWQNLTPKALTAWSKIGIVETSHFDAETVYLAVDRHRLDDRKPYVYRTHDGGQHWQLAATGIPDGCFVNAVREDPVRKGLLYAATEKGVFVSFDDGDHWQPLQLNLPVTSVRDLVIKNDDLVIATHGRGFWILDNASSLRQIDAQLESTPAALLEPARAIRTRPQGFAGTPLPKDEPMAPNPPNGAVIDYWLKASAKKLAIEVRDASGVLLRRYASDDPVPVYDPAKSPIAEAWFEVPPALSTTAGMHRAIWDFRAAAPAALADDGEQGIWAPPGTYSLTLDVDGQRYTQPLQLDADPRVELPAAAYAEQAALAKQVEALRARLSEAGATLAPLRKAVVAAQAQADKKTAPALAAYLAKLDRLNGTTVTPNRSNGWAFPPKQLTSFRAAGNALQQLAQAVDGADGEPTPDARSGYAKLGPIVDATIAARDRLMGAELEALNADLREKRMPPVQLQSPQVPPK